MLMYVIVCYVCLILCVTTCYLSEYIFTASFGIIWHHLAPFLLLTMSTSLVVHDEWACVAHAVLAFRVVTGSLSTSHEADCVLKAFMWYACNFQCTLVHMFCRFQRGGLFNFVVRGYHHR